MKTIARSLPNILVTFATAALVTVGVLASGQSPDASVLLAIAFTAGVAGWTFAQYRQVPGPLVIAASVHRLVPCDSARPLDCRALPQAA